MSEKSRNRTQPETAPSDKQNEANQPLPTEAYTDPAVFEQELDDIFTTTWQYVGAASEIAEPGDYITPRVGGKELIVLRDEDEDIRAFYNVCPHRGTKMLDGEGDVGRIQCPYHAWTFDTCGDLKSTPNFDPDMINYDEYGLYSVNVDTWGPLLFVNLEPESEAPLSDVVGPGMEPIQDNIDAKSMTLVESETYEMNSNWKAILDNFLECDHCHPVHDDFDLIQDVDNLSLEPQEHGFVTRSDMLEPDINISPYDTPADEWEARGGFYNYVWPNIKPTAVPGPVKNFFIVTFQPEAADRTIAKVDYYFSNDKMTEEKSNIIDFVDQVIKEDKEICERQYEGLRSNVLKDGVLSPTEKGIELFHNFVHERSHVTPET